MAQYQGVFNILFALLAGLCLSRAFFEINRVHDMVTRLGRRVDNTEKTLNEKTCSPGIGGGVTGNGPIVTLNTVPPPLPDHERADRDHGFGWKSAELSRLVDTACVKPGSRTWACEQYYKAGMPCTPGIQIWSALARADHWSYDPWDAAVAPNVTLDRLGKWAQHPGGYYLKCPM